MAEGPGQNGTRVIAVGPLEIRAVEPLRLIGSSACDFLVLVSLDEMRILSLYRQGKLPVGDADEDDK